MWAKPNDIRLSDECLRPPLRRFIFLHLIGTKLPSLEKWRQSTNDDWPMPRTRPPKDLYFLHLLSMVWCTFSNMLCYEHCKNMDTSYTYRATDWMNPNSYWNAHSLWAIYHTFPWNLTTLLVPGPQTFICCSREPPLILRLQNRQSAWTTCVLPFN